MECGSIIQVPTFNGMRNIHRMCHDRQGCPACQSIAAKGFAKQLAKANFLLGIRLSEADAKRMARRMGKAHYKRFPLPNGEVLLVHDVLKEAGIAYEGRISDLKRLVQNLPNGKRITGALGGDAREASRPWLATDTDEEVLVIETHHIHISGVEKEVADELGKEAYENAYQNFIKDLPLTDGLQIQQATNAVTREIRKLALEQGLTFDLFKPATYQCSLESVLTWKKEDTKLRAEANLVIQGKNWTRPAPPQEWLDGAKVRMAA